MNCTEFNNIILELDDINVLSNDMLTHLKECESCKQDYENIKNLYSELKPKKEIKTNKDFNKTILSKVEKINKTRKINIWKKISSIAAVFIIALSGFYYLLGNNNVSIISSANAAEKLFSHTISVFSNITSLSIKFKVRTLPQDNFEFIDKNSDFVNHKLIKEFKGKNRWKIEKTERVVVFDGKQKYLYIKNVGFAEIGNASTNYVDWMKRLLFPKKLFTNELNNIKKCKNCKYEITKNDNNIILTILSKANSNYKNPYLKNKSFDYADSKTIYTFSKQDTLLNSVKFYILDNNKYTLILDLLDIDYNVKLTDDDFKINLPKNITWHYASKTKNDKKFKNISSKQATELFFTAISKGNWESIQGFFPDFCNYNSKDKSKLINYYKGLKIIEIGKSFKSGNYPGEFVPYKIKLLNGNIIENNLALRNDNKFKIWQFDGGL